MKYRKKPVVIDAIPVNEALACAEHSWAELPDWLIEAYENGSKEDTGHVVFAADGVHITTLEGTMIGSRGDWIIRGVKGEIYPCKPDIFAETYDGVEF